MPKIRIDADERYPTYTIRGSGHEVNVSEEQLQAWQLAIEEYDKVQAAMGTLWRAAEDAHQAERARIAAERAETERLERERHREIAAARTARHRASVARLTDTTAYDRDGNPIGTIRLGTYGGLQLDVPEGT